MLRLNAANFASTKLAQAIDSTTTNITVQEALSVPPPFRVACEQEIMEVTAVNGTTWTVTRGLENTTAASHPAGASVTVVFTAGMFEHIRDELNNFIPETISVSYSDGRISQIVEQQGSFTRETSISYDSEGKVTSITQTLFGKTVTYTFNYTAGKISGITKSVS